MEHCPVLSVYLCSMRRGFLSSAQELLVSSCPLFSDSTHTSRKYTVEREIDLTYVKVHFSEDRYIMFERYILCPQTLAPPIQAPSWSLPPTYLCLGKSAWPVLCGLDLGFQSMSLCACIQCGRVQYISRISYTSILLKEKIGGLAIPCKCKYPVCQFCRITSTCMCTPL